jgi:hypothetical protein
MSDMHFYDPQLDPNLQGECAICGGQPDDPVHRGARIDALRVIAAREAELRAEVARLRGLLDEARAFISDVAEIIWNEIEPASNWVPVEGEGYLREMEYFCNWVLNDARATLAKIGGQ